MKKILSLILFSGFVSLMACQDETKVLKREKTSNPESASLTDPASGGEPVTRSVAPALSERSSIEYATVPDMVSEVRSDVPVGEGKPVEAIDSVGNAEQITSTRPLPHGRLSGIVNVGSHKEAFIMQDQQKLRLKQGDTWDGWLVAAIGTRSITVTQAGFSHELALSRSFDAPLLSASGQKRLQGFTENVENNAQTATATIRGKALILSEEQRAVLRTRLISE